jgi:hypothetical protein
VYEEEDKEKPGRQDLIIIYIIFYIHTCISYIYIYIYLDTERERGTRVHEIWKHGGMGGGVHESVLLNAES